MLPLTAYAPDEQVDGQIMMDIRTDKDRWQQRCNRYAFPPRLSMLDTGLQHFVYLESQSPVRAVHRGLEYGFWRVLTGCILLTEGFHSDIQGDPHYPPILLLIQSKPLKRYWDKQNRQDATDKWVPIWRENSRICYFSRTAGGYGSGFTSHCLDSNSAFAFTVKSRANGND